jgi:hypothetical protein
MASTICITAYTLLGHAAVLTFDPPTVPLNFIYWQGVLSRDIPIPGYVLKQTEDGLVEITLPDGRKFKFGSDPVKIDCPPSNPEGIS